MFGPRAAYNALRSSRRCCAASALQAPARPRLAGLRMLGCSQCWVAVDGDAGMYLCCKSAVLMPLQPYMTSAGFGDHEQQHVRCVDTPNRHCQAACRGALGRPTTPIVAINRPCSDYLPCALMQFSGSAQGNGGTLKLVLASAANLLQDISCRSAGLGFEAGTAPAAAP